MAEIDDLRCLLDYARAERAQDVKAIASLIRQGADPSEGRLEDVRYWLKFEVLLKAAIEEASSSNG